MENKKNNKSLRGLVFVIVGMIIVVVAAIFFRLFDRQTVSTASVPAIELASSLQEFSGDGYQANIPDSWYAETTTSSSVSFYPDYSPSASSSPHCKIALSVFPYASGTEEISHWISDRVGIDPTVSVIERSSESIPVGSSSGIRWSGTIDDNSVELVYAFNDSHAYEVAPSIMDKEGGPFSSCDDALGIFLSNFIF
jgi:hypothetical protein